jgi:polyisoprenoid-binding protein YceI
MRAMPMTLVLVTGAAAVVGGLMLGGAGQAQPATKAAAPAGGAFAVDAVHSSVIFGIKHLNVANFYGRFNKPSGTFLINKDDPSKSIVDVSIDANSVDTANEGRNSHLKSPDFFSTKEFGTITFKSKSFKKAEKANTYEVAGDLTFRGQTKPVTVSIEDTGTGPGMKGGTVAGIEARFTIKRSDFGMGFMPNGLSDEVSLIVSLEGKKD